MTQHPDPLASERGAGHLLFSAQPAGASQGTCLQEVYLVLRCPTTLPELQTSKNSPYDHHFSGKTSVQGEPGPQTSMCCVHLSRTKSPSPRLLSVSMHQQNTPSIFLAHKTRQRYFYLLFVSMSFYVAWDICVCLQTCLNESEFACEKNVGLRSPLFNPEKGAHQSG